MKSLRKLKVTSSRVKDKWSTFKENNYSNTENSKVWLFNLLSFTIIGSFFIDSGLPKIVSFVLFGGLGLLFIHFVRFLITFLLKPIFHHGVKSGVYTIMLFFLIFLPIYAGSYVVSMPLILFISFLVTAMEILFTKSMWSFFRGRRRSLPILLSLSITLFLNIIMSTLLITEGFKDNYIEDYLDLVNSSRNDSVSIDKEEMEKGTLSVSQIEYGQNLKNGLAPKTTDLTPYIDHYEGISSMIRGMYWGYDIDQVPLAGKVWYPLEGDNYPVLFIIHGNHIMTTQSYLGYDYLGEYLASYGYVVISVDESFCNAYINLGLSNENDSRAILLLENMRLIESYNNDQDSSLYQKMDFTNLALAGHSRGGESIATAALFNHYDNYPDNGNTSWNYHFNIKSLIAIAPTYDQYQPAQHSVQVNDMNYLLIHGANDQDVTNFMGYSQYHNVTFQSNTDLFKAYVYIAGANHGQFNTKWGRYDLSYPFKPFLNTKNLLEASKQRNILKAYTKAFLDVTLKNDSTKKGIFTGGEKSHKDLPDTIYIQNYQDSSFDLLCGFDEDSNINYGTTETVLLDADNVSLWKEEKNPIFYSGNDYVLHLEWKDTKEADYSVNLSGYNAKDGYLQFDIMDMNTENTSKNDKEFLNSRISLEDSEGNISTLLMRDYITIYPPLPVKISKLQFLTGTNDYKLCFQTVRLSSKEFENNNNDFDSSSIVNINFEFSDNENGKIMIDNIGFGR